MKKHPVLVMTVVLIAIILVSLTIGRYPMTLGEIYYAVIGSVNGAELTGRQEEILFLITDIRLPRIIAAILVGAALCSSGAVYQAIFMNPLVSPSALGVLAGASFGAGIGIVILSSWVATQLMAFIFAFVAVGLAVLISRLLPRSSLLVLVLGGLICSAFFMALTQFLQYIADPTSQLPELVIWIMGTFAHANYTVLMQVGGFLILGVFIMCFRGKLINVMSLGDEEALSLGINVKKKRMEMIFWATLVSACTVVIAGPIQWVGLVIPHVVRFAIGPDNRLLIPTAAVSGAAYMLVLDSFTRSVFTAEVPIGIITSIVCLPLFVVALYQNRRQWG